MFGGSKTLFRIVVCKFGVFITGEGLRFVCLSPFIIIFGLICDVIVNYKNTCYAGMATKVKQKKLV